MTNATQKNVATIGTKRIFTIGLEFGHAGTMTVRVSAVKTVNGYTLAYDTEDFRIVRRDVVAGRNVYHALEREGGPVRLLGYDLSMSAILESALSAF